MSVRRTDVCVVGGGIIGLAVAFELTRAGREVVVLERARVGERAAASVAAGMLAPIFEVDTSRPDLTRLALASRERYPAWAAAVEAASGERVGYEVSGSLIVALHRDHEAQIGHLRAFLRDRGLEARPVGRAELRELEPALAPSVTAGLLAPDDHRVDPRRLLRALAAALRRAGSAVREGMSVTRVAAGEDGCEVGFETGGERGSLRADQVVLAAGAWTGAIDAGGPPLPIRPVRGLILRLRGERLLERVVRTPDVYLVPHADDELVVGATMEERGFDAAPRAGDVLDLLREAARVLPGARELELAETAVGFRPALRDGLPAIGPMDRPGVFAATGHFRNGVLLAPITASLLARVMSGGEADPLLVPFAPARYAAAVPR